MKTLIFATKLDSLEKQIETDVFCFKLAMRSNATKKVKRYVVFFPKQAMFGYIFLN